MGWVWEYVGLAETCLLSASLALLAMLLMWRETMRTPRSA